MLPETLVTLIWTLEKSWSWARRATAIINSAATIRMRMRGWLLFLCAGTLALGAAEKERERRGDQSEDHYNEKRPPPFEPQGERSAAATPAQRLGRKLGG